MPHMMDTIVMRKCEISYKEAKCITALARQQLQLSEDGALLWSKEYETKCLEIHAATSNGSSTGSCNKNMSSVTKLSRARLQRHHSDSTDGNRSRESPLPRQRRMTAHHQQRKSRSLSKSRRKKSPAPEKERTGVLRIPSSTSTLSSLEDDIPMLSTTTTTTKGKKSLYKTSTLTSSTPLSLNCPSNHTHASLSPFSLDESIHSKTSPRRPVRQRSFNSHNDDTFVSTNAVALPESTESISKNHRPAGRGRDEKNSAEGRSSSRDRSKSVRLRRSLSRPRTTNAHDKNDNDDDNDTTNAQSPVTTTSILRRSTRWNDNEMPADFNRWDDTSNNESTTSPLASKRIAKGSSKRDNNSKSALVPDEYRLHRSLSYLQEESKKNKMYALPTPLTPEATVRPKVQSRLSSHRLNQTTTTTKSSSTPDDRWFPKLSPDEPKPAGRNVDFNKTSVRPKTVKLTKSDENFFGDSFRSVPSFDHKTNSQHLDDKHSYNSPATPTKQRPATTNAVEPRKPRRSSTTDMDDPPKVEPTRSRRSSTTDVGNHKVSSRAASKNRPIIEPLASTTTPTTTKKAKKSTTTRRRLSVEEIERECQADPSLRNVIAEQRNQSSLGTFINAKHGDTECSDDNQTVSTGSGASTKSKTRMVPVLKVKPSDDIPASKIKSIMDDENAPILSTKLSSPIRKKSAVLDRSFQSPPGIAKRMAAYKNSCESPLTTSRIGNTGGEQAPVSPSKFLMIPNIKNSPTQRTRIKKLELHHDVMKHNDRISPTTDKNDHHKISQHSVTSRTSHGTDTTISTSESPSDSTDPWYATASNSSRSPIRHHHHHPNDQIMSDEIFPEFAPTLPVPPPQQQSSDRQPKFRKSSAIPTTTDMSISTDSNDHHLKQGAPKLPLRQRSVVLRS